MTTSSNVTAYGGGQHAAPRPPLRGSSRVNVGQQERWLSAAGGGLLTWLGLRQRSLGGLVVAALGGALLYRGSTGHCPLNEQLGRSTAGAGAQPEPIELQATLTVFKPRGEVYAFWRNVENLPRFMRHLQSVQALDGRRSRWKARAPQDLATLEWDAEITTDEENEQIAWRSLPEATVHNAGTVRFNDAPGDRGTEVHVTIAYRPPAGAAGAALAQFFNPVNAQLIKEDLRRFRSVLEAGEVPTVEGQPAAR